MYTYSFTLSVENIPKLDTYLKSLFSFINSITYYEENLVLDIVTNKKLTSEEIQSLDDAFLQYTP